MRFRKNPFVFVGLILLGLSPLSANTEDIKVAPEKQNSNQTANQDAQWQVEPAEPAELVPPKEDKKSLEMSVRQPVDQVIVIGDQPKAKEPEATEEQALVEQAPTIEQKSADAAQKPVDRVRPFKKNEYDSQQFKKKEFSKKAFESKKFEPSYYRKK